MIISGATIPGQIWLGSNEEVFHIPQDGNLAI